MKTKSNYFLILLSFLAFIFFGFKGDDKRTGKINVNDVYEFIAINNILMWVSNNGDGSHDPRTDGNGLYWPGGINATKSAVFEDGLLFGGKVGGQIRVNGNTYRQGLQAGKIINGIPDDPSLEKYRVYKINKNWRSLPPGPERDAREKDYNEWPIEDGAPYVDVDGDGKPTPGIDEPYFIGDEVLWYVANDMDPTRSTFTYGTLPMGLEFQTTIFGFEKLNPLGDMVFKKYKIINKGTNTIRDMILSYWSDTDLGDANDDYTGCDTILNLGYTWNGNNNDGTYGTPPPAMGYKLLQGAIVPGNPDDSAKFDGVWRQGFKNLRMTAFTVFLKTVSISWFRDPQYGIPEEIYNYMRGYNWDGLPYLNPHTGLETRYTLSGDPVTGTGWFEGEGWPGGPPPADRRHIMSSGSFNLAPGDTQEFVIALIMAEGSSNKNSITILKEKSIMAQNLYNNDFKMLEAAVPTIHSVPQNRAVTLWWESNAEDFQVFDPLLPDTIRFDLNGTRYQIPVTDKTYDFEGYNVWQFKDQKGTAPVKIATFDIQNGIQRIYPYPNEFIKFNSNPLVEPVVSSPDLGLKRYITIDTDAYTNSPLYNGSEYYFAVTSYAYNKFSDPPVIESIPEIIEVIPGTLPIDVVSPYNTGDSISAVQTSGTGDGIVKIKIIDPAVLNGHEYLIKINGSVAGNNLNYSLFDMTRNAFLIENSTDFGGDFESKTIIDGFQLAVYNTGWDSIKAQRPATGMGESMVKDVVEVKGPGGIQLETPLSVFQNLNSTELWMIKAPGQNSALTLDSVDTRQNIDWTNSLGFNDYEIRFTPSGSQFYITGFLGIRPPFISDPRGEGIVPFEVWDVGGYNLNDTILTRHFIKIWDASIRDSVWTQNPATLDWEAIFSYENLPPYQEPLPGTSGLVPSHQHRLGNIVINGSIPETGTVIKVVTFKPLSEGDEFIFKAEAPRIYHETAKQNINNISVFPNPYYGANAAIGEYPPYVRFTNLPFRATIRIFSLAGIYITKFEKHGESQYLDWDLRNKDGHLIGSGIYLAYIEFPGVGTKVMKIAVIN